MPNLDIRQSEGLKKLNLVQCGTHGKLFSAKNPEAFCPMCGPDTLGATQLAKYTMGLMPVGFQPTNVPNTTIGISKAKRSGSKKPADKPQSDEVPAELKRLLSAPSKIPAGMKQCRAGKHTIPVDAKRCLPCNNEANKARREAKRSGAAK